MIVQISGILGRAIVLIEKVCHLEIKTLQMVPFPLLIFCYRFLLAGLVLPPNVHISLHTHQKKDTNFGTSDPAFSCDFPAVRSS